MIQIKLFKNFILNIYKIELNMKTMINKCAY